MDEIENQEEEEEDDEKREMMKIHDCEEERETENGWTLTNNEEGERAYF